MNTILKAIGSFGGNTDAIKADPKNTSKQHTENQGQDQMVPNRPR